MNVHHVALEVADLERSIDFYQKLVGFKLERRLQWEDERIAFLTLGPARLELVQPDAFVPRPSNVHIAFGVEDLTGWCSRLQREGIPLAEGPADWGNGWRSVFVVGPDGELLEFIEAPPEPHQAEAGDVYDDRNQTGLDEAADPGNAEKKRRDERQ
jgi:lactoylglutathione lyase